MNKAEVTSLLTQLEAQSLSAEDAYVQLGQEELGVGVAPVDLLRAGKRVFNNAFASIRSHICKNQAIEKAATDQNAIDSGTIAALILAAPGAVVWSSVNIALVSYIAARVGVRTLCASTWEERDA